MSTVGDTGRWRERTRTSATSQSGGALRLFGRHGNGTAARSTTSASHRPTCRSSVSCGTGMKVRPRAGQGRAQPGAAHPWCGRGRSTL